MPDCRPSTSTAWIRNSAQSCARPPSVAAPTSQRVKRCQRSVTIQYRPSRIPLTVATRVTLFDVDDYEARLYTVESDFIYQYNTSSFLNEGYRFYLLLRYDISTHWNIGIKYAITAYSDRDTFGSSYELIDANHRQQWRIQMRLKW